MSELDGGVILVTGASRGIGRRMSERFAEEGARVALLARSTNRLKDVSQNAVGETLVVPGDVTDSKSVSAAVERTVNEYGRLDTLVNNAGIGLLSRSDELKPVHEIGEEEWRAILEVNLTGAFLCAREALPYMLEQGAGNIVNISSILGHEAEENWAPYVSSKFGLEGLTKTIALEHAENGINVNGLYPGGRVKTAFWNHPPDAEREDIFDSTVLNDAAVLLAAQDRDGRTGESLDAATWEAQLR